MIRARVRGMKGLVQALEAFGRNTTKAKVLATSLRPAAANMRDAIRSVAPVSEGDGGPHGHYWKTIKIKRQVTRDGSAHMTIRSRGKKAPLSHLLEFGTVNMTARPHFKPAFDATYKSVLEIFATELWPRVAKEARFQANKTAKLAGKLRRR
jgi:HK97 gp10 family phage protein